MSIARFQPELMTGRLSHKDTKRYFSRFGWFAFSYFLITNITQTAILLAVNAFYPSLASNWLFYELLSFIPNYCVGLPLSFLFFLRRLPKDIPTKEKMTVGAWGRGFCICMTLMTVGSYISQIFLAVIESYMGQAPENPIESAISNMPHWATLLFVAVLAPVCEELVFRGIICRRLLPLGEGWAIVLSSAFFALFHGNFYQVFYAFTLGCLFSFVYLKTGRLIYSVLFHAAVNFIGGFLSSFLYEQIGIETFSENLNSFLTLPSVSFFTVSNLVSLLWFAAYMLLQGLITVGAVFGVIFLIKSRKKLRVRSGLLPSAEESAFKFFTSAGIIASIALFTIIMLLSVIPT